MQGRGADHAVRESCDRARTGRGTASRRSTSESPPSDEGAGERSGGASARFRWQPRSTAAALRACRRPRPPTWPIASGVNHRVTSPRWTSARSYAGQFPTRYFVVYLGCTLDFTSRSCPFGRHDGQGRDEHLFPRTNAGLNHAAYGLPVNASRPGSPQAHASLGSGWRPTLAGWDWIPTGFRTRFRRSHHGILSPLTGLSRHTRCCMNRS